MRRSLALTAIVSLSAALGCSNPVIHHSGDGGLGNGVGGGGAVDAGGGGGGGSDDGGASGGGNSAPDGGSNCGVQNFMLTKSGTPDLIIIQDRSASMNMDAMGGNTTPSKWTVVTQGIEQVLAQVTSVDWGLMMFAMDNQCGAPTMPDVAPAANTAAAITTLLGNTMASSSTPTTAAINNAVAYYKTLNDNHSHYLLVSTDGLPNCGSGSGRNDDSAAAEQAVADAATAGIKTFVVGIGNDPTGVATLTKMAINGQEPDTSSGTPTYYQVNNQADLVKVLQTAAGTIVSCDYALQSPPVNPDLVTIDDNSGQPIPRDPTHMNGWDYGPGDMSIVFYGSACTNLQMGVTTSISAVYGCPPIQ